MGYDHNHPPITLSNTSLHQLNPAHSKNITLSQISATLHRGLGSSTGTQITLHGHKSLRKMTLFPPVTVNCQLLLRQGQERSALGAPPIPTLPNNF